MATNLYETLGLNRDASPEQVRKAYRQKALQTHPDRLPPGASSVEKSAAEELFRNVNNAYEVLSDPHNRRVYDQHGVWPPQQYEAPPMPGRHRSRGAGNSFPDPYFDFGRMHDPFGFSFGGFGSSQQQNRGFTDPFELFNSIFGDMHQQFSQFNNDSFLDPFGGHGRSRGRTNTFNGFGPSFPFGPSIMVSNGNGHGRSGFHQSQHSFSSGSGQGRWVSESRSMTTINGVTESKWTRRDSSGNEHITYTYPDGTERTTINGVEQSSPHNDRYIQPPPPYPGHADVAGLPPPPVVSPRPNRHNSARPDNRQYGNDRINSPDEKASWRFWR
ncbi:hypothetical protein SERLA73DRAFT_184729 [Serpula lacrymans var. lacrymans S7.3]|uniref:J domain-containing protein n=2 Tax=Serpula lacrymans var. lacrymans TaxID=341189 RepID=F8Q4Z8_SERL3|nr:uncharacterized protein SERLADRAFT_472668 [Serpula lacrymans var. lacrymans S7.9]EGN96625.1 hypothetical protein SERLA73DRAFT_184729 [Serpula lacrymans var. lacrymans S7.3]EGO22193.1 hypothetical protein SERLADRAFT_472668 [Serpula lacrymans var. lacrymans S7.9]